MYAAALLNAIEECGVAVLTLVEGIEDSELLASRLTRHEVARQLGLMLAQALPTDVCAAMPEIDWTALATQAVALAGPASPARDETLLFAARSTTPALVLWLRHYRQSHPERFRLTLT